MLSCSSCDAQDTVDFEQLEWIARDSVVFIPKLKLLEQSFFY